MIYFNLEFRVGLISTMNYVTKSGKMINLFCRFLYSCKFVCFNIYLSLNKQQHDLKNNYLT